VFNVNLAGGTEVIAKFENESKIAADGKRRDHHYNGVLSLERQRNLCSLVGEAGLPAPEVKGVYSAEGQNFLLAEKMSGQYWSDFLEDNNHSLAAFTRSLEFLGADIAMLQRCRFSSFGDVISPDRVEPPGITHFAQRLRYTTDLKLQREAQKGSLHKKELREVTEYFQRRLQELSQMSGNVKQTPVFILADLHARNFFVDSEGKPSGYFDLEFCQAGVPSLEFGSVALFLYSYYGQKEFEQGRAAFFRGFHDHGGVHDLNDPYNTKLEEVLGAGYLLSFTTGYHDSKDGLRDLWSAQFKELLFQTIASEMVPYVAVGDVFRTKTKQPKEAF